MADETPDAEISILLNERVYQRIKLDILQCRLEPGSEVSETQLAERYNCGKGPLRTALQRIGQDGLIKALPRRGYQVAPITLKDVHETFQMRALLEPFAAKLAAGRVDPKQLKQLDDVCHRTYSPDDVKSRLEYLEANRSFHVLVAKASGNLKLAATLGHILDEMNRILFVGLGLRDRTLEMQAEHSKLIAALVAGDGEGAERIAQEQVEASRKMVLDAIMSSEAMQNVALSATASGSKRSAG
jgi:DNA-binding GntR family transcriptional regulator